MMTLDAQSANWLNGPYLAAPILCYGAKVSGWIDISCLSVTDSEASEQGVMIV